MPSEVKRGSVRILANYTRVFATVGLGLVLVRLLLAGMGNEGWALIALLGSTLGMAAMIQDIVRASMIRELGAAHHSGQPTTFRSTYNAAVAISAVTALLAAGTFTALWFIVPWFKISPDLIPAAQWLVAARGAQVFVVILLTAPFNMYKVTERMVAHNAWLVADRLCYVLAAVWILFTQGTDDPASQPPHASSHARSLAQEAFDFPPRRAAGEFDARQPGKHIQPTIRYAIESRRSPPLTGTGTLLSPFIPLPSVPQWLKPQQYVAPVVTMPQLWPDPAITVV